MSFNEKSDVYSFGIVLLELITGQPSLIEKYGYVPPCYVSIVDWVEPLFRSEGITKIVDSEFNSKYDIDSVDKAYNIAMACVSKSASSRPIMYNVFSQLNECLELENPHEKIFDSKSSFPSGFEIEIASASTVLR